MNERIRELAEQTGFRYDNGEWQFGDDSDVQKFAELIVQECMNAVCDPMTTYLESMTDSSAMYTARERIRKHFGVGE